MYKIELGSKVKFVVGKKFFSLLSRRREQWNDKNSEDKREYWKLLKKDFPCLTVNTYNFQREKKKVEWIKSYSTRDSRERGRGGSKKKSFFFTFNSRATLKGLKLDLVEGLGESERGGLGNINYVTATRMGCCSPTTWISVDMYHLIHSPKHSHLAEESKRKKTMNSTLMTSLEITKLNILGNCLVVCFFSIQHFSLQRIIIIHAGWTRRSEGKWDVFAVNSLSLSARQTEKTWKGG